MPMRTVQALRAKRLGSVMPARAAPIREVARKARASSRSVITL